MIDIDYDCYYYYSNDDDGDDDGDDNPINTFYYLQITVISLNIHYSHSLRILADGRLGLL